MCISHPSLVLLDCGACKSMPIFVSMRQPFPGFWWGRLTALRANVSPFPCLLMQRVFCCLRSFSFLFRFRHVCKMLARWLIKRLQNAETSQLHYTQSPATSAPQRLFFTGSLRRLALLSRWHVQERQPCSRSLQTQPPALSPPPSPPPPEQHVVSATLGQQRCHFYFLG